MPRKNGSPLESDGMKMQDILIYGDSPTWGIIPMTRNRFAFSERWPGMMENELNAAGRRVRVIEDCLNDHRERRPPWTRE
jgi:hypothetical protein